MTDWLAPSWARLKALPSSASPAYVVFIASLLLSLIAIWASPTLNRDGIFYVDAARAFLSGGFMAARTAFNWPFLPVLMALLSRATGLGLENSGYLMNAMFLAGACGLMVSCASRRFPEAVWPTCLVVLALPGLNHYRDEILREYGCWFFFMLSFWLALRWSELPRWRSALAAQIALGLAALFRPEALAFFPALAFWQLFAAPKGEKWVRALTIAGLPLLGLAVLTVLFYSGKLESWARFAIEFGRLNMAGFDAKASGLSSALFPYARDQARTILFFGSIAIIPLNFIKHIGVFLLPLIFLLSTKPLRKVLVRWQPFSWAFLAHLLVLMVFVLDLQFLAGRYVAVLCLLAAPPIGYGLWLLMQRFPRCNASVIILAVLMMVSNVVSLNPGNRYFTDAGRWLAQNATESSRIYIESARAAYYAGWGTASARLVANDRSLLPEKLAQGQYDLVVLEVSHKDPDITPWLASNGLREIRRFSDTNRDAVIIAELSRKTQDSASKTERMREKTGSIE